MKDPSLLQERGRPYADLPGGHSEGYDDTFKQVFRRFYRPWKTQRAGGVPAIRGRVAAAQILEKVLESSQKHAWVEVPGMSQASTV